MCRRHWAKVPLTLQRMVHAKYRRGQCDDKQPSREWHQAASAAIASVALQEGYPIGVSDVEALLALYPQAFGEKEQEIREKTERNQK
jgi:hypothetical protein